MYLFIYLVICLFFDVTDIKTLMFYDELRAERLLF